MITQNGFRIYEICSCSAEADEIIRRHWQVLSPELAIGSGFGERTAKFKILRRSFVAVCYNYLNLGKRQMSKFIRFILVSICACAIYAGLKYAFILFITWLMFSGVYFDGPGTLLAIPLTFLSSSVIFDYYCIALGSHLLFLSLLKGRDVKTRWILPLFFLITLAFCSFCVLIGHEDYQRINALFALLLISPFTLIAYAIVTTVILAKNKISDYYPILVAIIFVPIHAASIGIWGLERIYFGVFLNATILGIFYFTAKIGCVNLIAHRPTLDKTQNSKDRVTKTIQSSAAFLNDDILKKR